MPSIRVYQKKQIRLDRLNFRQTQMFKIGNVGVAAVKPAENLKPSCVWERCRMAFSEDGPAPGQVYMGRAEAGEGSL